MRIGPQKTIERRKDSRRNATGLVVIGAGDRGVRALFAKG
jgi:hypothetical protein